MNSARGSLLAIALLAMLGASWCIEAPLLMWSGSNYFAGKDMQIKNTIESAQFNTILAKIATNKGEQLPANLASIFRNGHSTPEVLVLYLEPTLRTDQVSRNAESLARLRQQLLASKSSVVVPFVVHEEGVNGVAWSVASVASSLPAGAKVLFQGQKNGELYSQVKRAVPSTEVVNVEALPKEIFTNGLTDLLIVPLSMMESTLSAKLSKDDEKIAAVQKIVEENTQGNYVALFTSESVVEPSIETTFHASKGHIQLNVAVREQEEINEDEFDTDADEEAPNPPRWATYFPAWFWEGGVTLVFFAATGLIIIMSLMSLQAPTVFLAEKKKND